MSPHSAERSGPDTEAFVELLEDEAGGPAHAGGPAVWKVLIVDDDEDVHRATELALRGIAIEGRPLEFLHARSAAQAIEVARAQPDIAVALLDVVMESPDAGLRLVRTLREELGRHALRVVLRTGQPGYAPEIETIRNYDINDYKTKSELTRVRLYTSLTAAIRSYRQILTLEQTRSGLEIVVSASTHLGRQRGLQRFSEGLVTQLSALLGVTPEGLVCAQAPDDGGDDPVIIAAAGRYSELIHRPLRELPGTPLREALTRCLQQQRSVLEPGVCLYFSAPSGRGIAAYVEAGRELEALDERLLEVFAASMSVAFENVLLYSQLVDYAYHDQLLRMPNRNRFVELIGERLRQPEGAVLALVDIDDFAAINDTLGHQVGDQVLQAAAQRLVEALGDQVVMARLGGDTFGVLGPESVVNPQVLERAFASVVEVQGERMRISVTSGLVRLAADSPPGFELIKDAHLALKQAKQHRRGSSCYFSERMGVDARERMRLLRSLRGAFDESRLYVAYQPLVAMETRTAVGLEALIRWRLDDGRFVPPDRFIPLAERSGLIVSIGEFVLRNACFELVRLHHAGHRELRMSVNVSKAQFTDPDFLPSVARALQDARLDPRALELEITESVAVEDLEFVLGVLADLRRLGVSLAVDDFGTGYSSLGVLRQLGAHRLKIDRSFIHELDGAAAPVPDPQPDVPGQGTIARMVVDLGCALGMEIVAEGVETETQHAALRALGCHIGQGYLYARPMPAEDLLGWLGQA